MAASAVHCQQSPSNKILSLGNCRAKNLCRSQTSCTVFRPSLKLGPKLWHLEGSLFPREPLQRFRIQYYHCYRLPCFFNQGCNTGYGYLAHDMLEMGPFPKVSRSRLTGIIDPSSGERLVMAHACGNPLRTVEMNLTSRIWPAQ